MPWPTRTAAVIAERIASSLEASISAVKPAVDPLALSRAVRSARGMLAQLGRAVALELREVHDHVSWWGRQYFVDTAEEEFVYRHAAIWGVVPRAATVAIGSVAVEGTVGTAVPEGLEFSGSNGVIYRLTEAGTIGQAGEVLLPIAAAVAGPSGNVETGIRLATVTPFPSISRVTVAGTGVAGGADEETPQELALSVRERIRQPPHGGAGFDYAVWLARAFKVKAVRVYPDWVGRGSLGVVVAMAGDELARAPTVDELDAMLTYLGPPGTDLGVRPVTAHVLMVAAIVRELPIRVRLRPDTVATRAAVTEAWNRFVATIGDEEDAENASPIGALIERSRISEAISAAAGEYAHDLLEPAASFTLERVEYPVPGVVEFEAAS